MVFPLKIVIFHSYVKLPEGIPYLSPVFAINTTKDTAGPRPGRGPAQLPAAHGSWASIGMNRDGFKHGFSWWEKGWTMVYWCLLMFIDVYWCLLMWIVNFEDLANFWKNYLPIIIGIAMNKPLERVRNQVFDAAHVSINTCHFWAYLLFRHNIRDILCIRPGNMGDNRDFDRQSHPSLISNTAGHPSWTDRIPTHGFLGYLILEGRD